MQKAVANVGKNAFQPGMNVSCTEKKLKTIEIRLCMYVAEHNHSALSLEHLVQLFKSSFKMLNPLNKLSEKLCCARTKATAIIQNVLGKSGEEELCKKLQQQHFALLIDESTDVSSDQHLAMVVRTFDAVKFTARDEFLTLLAVANRTAQGLHDGIVKYFKDDKIPYLTNMKEFGSDNAATMVGCLGGVGELFKKEIPELIIMRCFCH